jgi:hypothetical protein
MIINFHKTSFSSCIDSLIFNRLIFLLISIALFINCTRTIVKTENYGPITPTDIGNPIKVAILNFEDDPENPGSGSVFAPIFMDALMEIAYEKYIFLERSKINEVLKEFSLKQAGLIDEDESKQIGKLIGADAIIIGKVNVWQKGTIFKQAAVGYSARCVTVETGKILWYSSYSGTVWKNALEQRKPEIIARDAALKGLEKIRYMLFKTKL